jgi:hypothetical protein
MRLPRPFQKTTGIAGALAIAAAVALFSGAPLADEELKLSPAEYKPLPIAAMPFRS